MNETGMQIEQNMPEDVPAFAMIPAAEPPEEALCLIPATEDLRSSRLRLSGAQLPAVPAYHLEEDLLVPDIRPDLEKILSITGVFKTKDAECYPGANGKNILRIQGTVEINVLYLPQNEKEEIVSIKTLLPFRQESEVQNAPTKNIESEGCVKNLSGKVINERKIRVTGEIDWNVRLYGNTEIEILEGVRDDSILLKKEPLSFSDIAQQKTDITEIREIIRLKEGQPKPEQLLWYDIHAVEQNHQVTREKAVITGNLYYSVLYLPEAAHEKERKPVYYRGKTEFTQFLRLSEAESTDAAGSMVHFALLKAEISLRHHASDTEAFEAAEDYIEEAENNESEDSIVQEGEPVFRLQADIAAGIRLYRNLQREVVTDMYHRTKELEYSATPYEISEFCGSTREELNLRELLTIPETEGSAAEVYFVDLRQENLQAKGQNGQCGIDGTLEAEILFREAQREEICTFRTTIPFHTELTLSGVNQSSRVQCTPAIREIRFERINAQQLEVRCILSLCTAAWNVRTCSLIDKVCYIENERKKETIPEIVVYTTRPGDTQWSVAKKFRTSTAELQRVNALEEETPLSEGTKLLIV